MRNDKPREWTEGEVQMLIEMSSNGASAIEIATALHRYLASVRRVAHDRGIPLRG